MDSLQTILQKLFIFRDCRAAHIRDVLKICSSRTFKADERLCSQGERAKRCLLFSPGACRLTPPMVRLCYRKRP